MKGICTSYAPGDIVHLAGISFVVLEDLAPFSDEGAAHNLFILALEGQGESRFGDTNNYAKSELKSRVDDWLYRLTEKMMEQGLDPDLIRTRTISLTTLNDYKGYGDLEVKAAPLTLDEFCQCRRTEAMPDLDIASWLATGWGEPGVDDGVARALFVSTNGYWCNDYCFDPGYAIRPALVVSSSLFAGVGSDNRLRISK